MGLVFLFLSSFLVSASLATDTEMYYTYDNADLSGSNPDDTTGNGYDGTTSGATTGITGKINETFSYDGINDYITITGDPLNGISQMTFSTWFYVTGGSDNRYLFNRPGTGVDQLYLSGSDTIVVDFGTLSGGRFTAQTTTSFSSINTWYHLVVVYNSSQPTASRAKIYIDNSIQPVTNALSGSGSFTAATHTISKSSDAFEGRIDETAIFDTALTTSQIASLYNGGLGNQYPYTTPQFELTASNIFNGSTINNFNATIVNGTTTTFVSTSNGTIFFPLDTIINITLESTNYFNRSFINYNSSNNLNAEMWQAILYTRAQDIFTLEKIGIFNMTYGGQFNTSNNNFTTHYVNAGTFTYQAKAPMYIDNTTGTIGLSALSTNNITINFTRDIQNDLFFIDAETGSPLVNASVNVLYPNAISRDLITNSSGGINFSFIAGGVEIFGNYQITFQSLQGYISPVIINEVINESTAPLNKTYNISVANLIINIFDRETFQKINQKVDIIIVKLLNGSTTNGTLIIKNQSIVSGTYTVQAISNGYITEEDTFTYTNEDNLTVDLFLLNATGNTTGNIFVTVKDELFRELQGAVIELYEYKPTTLTYEKVSQCLSNSNGECVFAVEIGTKRYIVTGEKTINNILFETATNSEGTIFFTDPDFVTLRLRVGDVIKASVLDNLVYTITESFVNNVSDIDVEFRTLNGAITEVCVEYFLQNGSVLQSLPGFLFCANSSSAKILINSQITLTNRNYTYVAQVYQNLKGGKTILQEYIYSSLTESFEGIMTSEGFAKILILYVWILILGFSLYVQNMTLFVFLGLIWSWGQRILLFDLFIPEVAVLQTVILVTMFIVSRKRQEEP